jgi:hypothetical protein
MRNLSAVVLLAGLCVAMGLLWFPSSWLGWLADRVTRLMFSDAGEQPGTAGDRSGEADRNTLEWESLTRPYIRGRLDALAQELERLDRDPDVFARAFHTMAARSAREALLADASRLADRPAAYAGHRFEIEAAGTSTGPIEELEL